MNPGKRHLRLGAPLVAALGLAVAMPSMRAQAGNPEQAIDAAFNKYKTLKEGKNADYIPALAKVDPLGGNPYSAKKSGS